MAATGAEINEQAERIYDYNVHVVMMHVNDRLSICSSLSLFNVSEQSVLHYHHNVAGRDSIKWSVFVQLFPFPSAVWSENSFFGKC